MAKNVLVLDHEAHMARLVQVNLERAGYAVATAGSAREALAMVEEERPDLVIVNPLTPGCAEFVYALKSDPATRDVRIITLPPRSW